MAVEGGKASLLLEACTEGFAQSLHAEKNGAHRIELCENLAQGGTTPSFGMIKVCTDRLSIPISVMIRPRGGDFVYSEDELDIMRNDILVCKNLQVDGVVFGVLRVHSETGKTEIDVELLEELMRLAKPLKVTFHMAFDEVDDQEVALEQLIKLHVTRVLTKGGKVSNALQGKESLKRLVEQANGRIAVMPGKGINKQNYMEIADFTGAQELHGTQII